MRRSRNAESARRTRQKKKDEDDSIQKSLDENERRIAHLEQTVLELSSELAGDSPTQSWKVPQDTGSRSGSASGSGSGSRSSGSADPSHK